MTLAIPTGLTTYIPLVNNIPSWNEAERLYKWQKKATPDTPLTIVSSDTEIDGITRNYNDYDWSNI